MTVGIKFNKRENIEHALMYEDTWVRATVICKERFLKLLEGMPYSPSELSGQWWWFNQGWRACRPETFNQQG